MTDFLFFEAADKVQELTLFRCYYTGYIQFIKIREVYAVRTEQNSLIG